MFRITPNYNNINRGEAERDNYDDLIISNYQFDFFKKIRHC